MEPDGTCLGAALGACRLRWQSAGKPGVGGGWAPRFSTRNRFSGLVGSASKKSVQPSLSKKSAASLGFFSLASRKGGPASMDLMKGAELV